MRSTIKGVKRMHPASVSKAFTTKMKILSVPVSKVQITVKKYIRKPWSTLTMISSSYLDWFYYYSSQPSCRDIDSVFDIFSGYFPLFCTVSLFSYYLGIYFFNFYSKLLFSTLLSFGLITLMNSWLGSFTWTCSGC